MNDIIAALITASATLFSAFIIGIAGGIISHMYAKERDKQDKESQWRNHAIELTKLDLQRKTLNTKNGKIPRISILDFLANYRDLKELDYKSPKELYSIIKESRTNPTQQEDDH
ncbi:hypothetical protein [Autumnicola psychrophila]|uniref:Phage protein n=1 Tax=Autumnicola psychrophila TaxID=3075592 RepID=A0ABU3DPG0_9FLAO|nr:hypothetical protein [Zunongwangia sp. F225]MDT0685581.1 hypothetical protein [Zunongwangia sp. F225]